VTEVKRIICLANSRKLSERCVAGLEVSEGGIGEWIRPVSARSKGEVSYGERQYPDGSDPAVLDIMDVPLLEPRPKDYQQENWLLDPQGSWEHTGSLPREGLLGSINQENLLWSNGRSTYHGQNDEIPLAVANTLTDSLRLVHTHDLLLRVFDSHYQGQTRRRVQGVFHRGDIGYRLYVTDPVYEEPYKTKPNGDVAIGESLLTISLSEPFQERDACYKLIAGIIELDYETER